MRSLKLLVNVDALTHANNAFPANRNRPIVDKPVLRIHGNDIAGSINPIRLLRVRRDAKSTNHQQRGARTHAWRVHTRVNAEPEDVTETMHQTASEKYLSTETS